MALTFDELVGKFGSPDRIPNEDLYGNLCEYREELATALSGLDSKTIGARPGSIGNEVQRRCKQDLFWMARYFTWETNPAGGFDRPVSENLITEDPYRVICDFFVHKDDTKSIADQDAIKNRLLLWPRGGFKSTIDVVDVVQWILNFPDIRILFLTGADDLAVGFVDETKSHFIRREAQISLMNVFFPEYCIPENHKENEFQFTCPIWAAKQIKRKEPTVLASSVGSTKSGLHFEVAKGDDPVTDKNSESAEQCAKISKQLFLSKKLLRTGGRYYYDLIGTRYDDEDHYGVTLEKNVGEIKSFSGLEGKTPRPWELTINETTATKILIGRGLQIRQEVAQQLREQGDPVTYQEAGEEGCYLLIPGVMSFKEMIRQFVENEETFEGQINQNPRPASSTTFERKDLIAATVRFDQMPFSGPVSVTWDFAFSTKKGRDFSTASAVRWTDKAQMYVMDLIRQRFKPDDLAQAVVDFTLKWHPFVIGIEDASGSQLLEPTIIEKAKKTGDEQVIAVCSKIDWIKPDTQVDAKKIRMGTLHPPLLEGRLLFANYLPFLPVLYDEFERCMTSKQARNDIPDVISQQLRYAPRIQTLIERQEIPTFGQDTALWNMIFEDGDAFGRPGMGGPPIPIVEVEPEPEVEGMSYAPGLDNILGAGILG